MFYNDEVIFLEVELKYCERCGSLYLRPSKSEAKFCLPCIETERGVFEQALGGKHDQLAEWMGAFSALIHAARDSKALAELKGGIA